MSGLADRWSRARTVVRTPRPLPWARPRREIVLLALVAVAALSPVVNVSSQDESRICLSEALLHARVSNDSCFAISEDHASHDGHLYSDKAPGLSLLEVPSVALLRPGPPQRWSTDDLRIWGVRVLSVGLSLLVCAFLIGRVAEGLAPGYGGVVLVTFALGTLVAPLSAMSFEHVPAAALAFAAFLLAWGRRPGLAGVVAGAAVLVEYECGVVVIVLACYLALLGWRPLARFVAGLVPSAVALGAYDWAAFGAPWHLSYRDLGSYYAAFQAQGLFGISVPSVAGTVEVFAGPAGLLVVSPVLVMAVFGLVRLGRAYRAEAAVAGIVAAIYILANCGYFQPYGGDSPGPRFLAVALPFLALGLANAFAWRPRLTVVAAALSIVPIMAIAVTWSSGTPMSGTVWVQLARIPAHLGSSTFVRSIGETILSASGTGRDLGAALVGACAAAAFVLAVRTIPWSSLRAERARATGRRRPRLGAIVIAGSCAYLVAVSDVAALTNSPYGDTPPKLNLVALHTSLAVTSASYVEGGEVNLKLSVVDGGPIGAGNLVLHIMLSPGLRLVGRPISTLGAGCVGSAVLRCNLAYITAMGSETATVYLGVQITRPTAQAVSAYSSATGDHHSNTVAATIPVGS